MQLATLFLQATTGALQNFDHSFKLQANLGDVEGLIVLHTNMGLIELDLGDLAEAEARLRSGH